MDSSGDREQIMRQCGFEKKKSCNKWTLKIDYFLEAFVREERQDGTPKQNEESSRIVLDLFINFYDSFVCFYLFFIFNFSCLLCLLMLLR